MCVAHRANGASRPSPGFRPPPMILKLYGKMVGATGVEPVTPTMSTDAELLNPLKNPESCSGNDRHTTGMAGEHEEICAQAGRKQARSPRHDPVAGITVFAELTGMLTHPRCVEELRD